MFFMMKNIKKLAKMMLFDSFLFLMRVFDVSYDEYQKTIKWHLILIKKNYQMMFFDRFFFVFYIFYDDEHQKIPKNIKTHHFW